MFWCGQDHTEGEITPKIRLLSVGKLLESHKGGSLEWGGGGGVQDIGGQDIAELSIAYGY